MFISFVTVTNYVVLVDVIIDISKSLGLEVVVALKGGIDLERAQGGGGEGNNMVAIAFGLRWVVDVH